VVGVGADIFSTDTAVPEGVGQQVVRNLFPEENPYLQDPMLWIDERLDEHVWSKQREIIESVRDRRYTAVQSCHDTGKSYTASRIASWWIDAHPPGDAFVVSTAPSQTQVEAILWREIGRAHRRGNLVGRITSGMIPQWKIGPEIVGYGRKPQDLASKEEAMAAFSGIHAKWVLVLIDEGGGVPKWLFDAVDTLLTNESARCLVIGNPDDPASEFAKVCAPGSGWHTISISYDDTPAWTGEAVPTDLLDLLISKTWVEERKVRWGEGSPLYVSKVLGQFPEVTDDTLISPAMLRKGEELDLSGMARAMGQFGWDIARFGADRTVGYRNRKGYLRLVKELPKQDTMKTAGQIKHHVDLYRGAIPAIVDVIGIGAGVVDRLKEQGVRNVIPFNSSERALNPRRFANRRAEVYWGFREQLEDGRVDLPPDGEDDELKAQLGSIKWYLDSSGRIHIEKKEDMKKRGLPSPDRADAAVMACLPNALSLPDREARQAMKNRDTVTGDLLEREM